MKLLQPCGKLGWLLLAILQLNKEHEIAVIEMGASKIGDIKELVEIALPNYGIITNIGKAHLEGFRDVETIKKTKFELYDFIIENKSQNIKETQLYTINHVFESITEDAHHTSAKYPEEISEFDQTSLMEEYKEGIKAPFVKNAPLQLGCRYLNEYQIKENDTSIIIGQIEHIFIEEEMLLEDGWVQLDKGGVVAINGLDGYAIPKLIERFTYARPKIKAK